MDNENKGKDVLLYDNDSNDDLNNNSKKKKQVNNIHQINKKICHLRQLLEELERKKVCNTCLSLNPIKFVVFMLT
jgi:hypothetical protein